MARPSSRDRGWRSWTRKVGSHEETLVARTLPGYTTWRRSGARHWVPAAVEWSLRVAPGAGRAGTPVPERPSVVAPWVIPRAQARDWLHGANAWADRPGSGALYRRPFDTEVA